MDYLKFFTAITAIKQITRTGWMREGVKDPESVADHSFGITVLAMIFANKCERPLNREKLIRMALIHDVGELGGGDTVIDRGSALAEKQKITEKNIKEKQRIEEIFDYIGEGKEYAALFDEMIYLETYESQVVKQLDKLEMAMQAFIYEKEQGKNLEEFFINTKLYLSEPILQNIFQKIVSERLSKSVKRD